MLVYKLTDQKMQTLGGFQWEAGKIREASGDGPLCSKGWLHAYESPPLAVLHNPIHANIANPRLFSADTLDGEILRDGMMKLGSTRLVLLEEIPLPQISLTQRAAYGILCALEVYREPGFVFWASRWISGEDRSALAAWVARTAASRSAWTASGAAREAASAAWAAGWAASAAWAAGWAAWAAARAAGWAAEAGWAAAWAAEAAASAMKYRLDIKSIAEVAMTY